MTSIFICSTIFTVQPFRCNCALRRAENGTYRKLKTGRFLKTPLSVARFQLPFSVGGGLQKCKIIFKRQGTTGLTVRPQGFSGKASCALSVARFQLPFSVGGGLQKCKIFFKRQGTTALTARPQGFWKKPFAHCPLRCILRLFLYEKIFKSCLFTLKLFDEVQQ